ncbi:MAG TPA: hypothetical protein VKB47_05105 [Terracidiphilus sp.]|nr:hypothetical protein [Terracidiphilus sp.]
MESPKSRMLRALRTSLDVVRSEEELNPEDPELPTVEYQILRHIALLEHEEDAGHGDSR